MHRICQPRFLQSQNSGSPRVVSHAWVFALGLLADSLLTQLSRARGAMPRDFPRLRCCDYSFAAVLVNHSIVKLTVSLCRWCRCLCGPQAPLGEIVYSRFRVGPYLSLAVRACCNLARLHLRLIDGMRPSYSLSSMAIQSDMSSASAALRATPAEASCPATRAKSSLARFLSEDAFCRLCATATRSA